MIIASNVAYVALLQKRNIKVCWLISCLVGWAVLGWFLSLLLVSWNKLHGGSVPFDTGVRNPRNQQDKSYADNK